MDGKTGIIGNWWPLYMRVSLVWHYVFNINKCYFSLRCHVFYPTRFPKISVMLNREPQNSAIFFLFNILHCLPYL